VTSPYAVVAVQALDGISAAILGVTLPLVVADITRGTGRFNLGLGIVGSAVGIGAALSTTLAGYTIDRFGSGVAFCGLASVAVRIGPFEWAFSVKKRISGCGISMG
jgi:MFS family permease